MADESPVDTPVTQTEGPRKWRPERLIFLGIVGVAGVGLIAVLVRNFLFDPVTARQAEARTNLERIWLAENTFYKVHKRYGTFGEIGFWPAQPPRYMYRLDRTGRPGTVIPSTIYLETPDNSRVRAGFTATGFTVTATANIDDDPVVDQWHVNDAKQGLDRADVDDARN